MSDYSKFEAMAKLELPETERQKLYCQIEQQLGAIDAAFGAIAVPAGTAPLVTVLKLQNALREDIPSKSITRGELLASAPAEYDGYFQVPKTLE